MEKIAGDYPENKNNFIKNNQQQQTRYLIKFLGHKIFVPFFSKFNKSFA